MGSRPLRRAAGILRYALPLLIAATLPAGAAHATSVPVPNGAFTSSTNANAGAPIGGGLLTGSASNVAIGSSGPWTGTYSGVVGVIAPPTLEIDSSAHQATIGGILGLNVLDSLVANAGSFNQIFPNAAPGLFQANKIYRLGVDVDAAAIAGVDLLGNGIVGSALTSSNAPANNTVTVASSDTNPAILSLLSPDHYRLTLSYTTPASGAVIGRRIGVSLFSRPGGIASLSLISAIDFSNTTLDRFGTIPASIAVTIGSQSGSQSATVGQAFAHPLSVTVVDSDGDAVPGVSVTFAAPASGPAATLSQTTVQTGDDGTATATATANTVAGGYTVTATVAGVATPATFSLTNTAGPPAHVAVVPPAPTSATVGTAFATLTVQVTDQFGNPVADGTPVTANATTAQNGASTQSTVLMTTTSGGQAQFNESANTVAGSYDLTVDAGAASSDPLTLANTAGAASKVKPGVNGNANASGTPQSATITLPFGLPLTVLVTDQFDNAVSGATVTFAPPASGAGAHLSSSNPTTNAGGVAAVDATANATAGAYQVTASVAGGTESMTFDLTNTGAITTPGGGSPQTGVSGVEFDCALIAHVANGQTAIVGIDVTFTAGVAPGGASATFSSIGGSENTNPLTVTTDATGAAAVVATGNAFGGTYTVTAQIPGTGQSASYVLTNLAVGDRAFYDGFEPPGCSVASN